MSESASPPRGSKTPGNKTPAVSVVPEVSVVIAAFNRRADLRRCLLSLAAVDDPVLDVIVIDDGSSDGTAKMVLTEFPEVALYRADRNLGLAKARNIGARVGDGAYIWYLDSDTELLDPALPARLVAMMESQPRLGAVGGEGLVDVEGRVVGTKTLIAEPNGMVRGDCLLDCDAYQVIPACLVAGCNFFLRRETLSALGGFDETYLYPAFDDVDLSVRIRKLGLDLAVLGRVPLQHHFSGQARFRNVATAGRYRVYFIAKNFPLWRLVLMPLLDLLYLIDPRHVLHVVRRARIADSRIGIRTRLVPWGHAGKGRARRAIGALSVALFKIATLGSGYLFAWPDLAKALKHRAAAPDDLAAARLDAVRDLRADERQTA